MREELQQTQETKPRELLNRHGNRKTREPNPRTAKPKNHSSSTIYQQYKKGNSWKDKYILQSWTKVWNVVFRTPTLNQALIKTNRASSESSTVMSLLKWIYCLIVNLKTHIKCHPDASGDRDRHKCYDVINDIYTPSHENLEYLLDRIPHERERHG